MNSDQFGTGHVDPAPAGRNHSDETPPAASRPSGAVDRLEVLRWIRRRRAELRETPTRKLLDFDGIDAVDLLVSPLFVAGVNALRTAGAPRPPIARRLFQKGRELAYRGKLQWKRRAAARSSSTAGATEVLFWPREITHLAVFGPVRRALEAQGIKTSMLTCQPIAADRNQPGNVYTEAVWPERVQQAREEGLRRARALASPDAWPRLASDSPHDRILETSLRDTVVQLMPAVSVSVANAQAAIEQFSPRALVVGNDLTLEGRTACQVASARGLPTAVFMHGNITASVLHAEHCADRLLVFGEAHRQILLRLGIASDLISICGAPQLDGRVQQSGQIDARLQKLLGLKPGRPWILVATSGPGNSISHKHHQLILENIARVARANPDVPIVCKLHRKDRVTNYREFFKQCSGLNVSVIPRSDKRFPYDIFEWLKGCSMLLTGASTVAVEGMLMDVPIITMDFASELRSIDFIDAGATMHTTSAAELQHAVETVLRSGLPAEVQAQVRQYVERAFYSLDGKSAERGADLIVELAGMRPAAKPETQG